MMNVFKHDIITGEVGGGQIVDIQYRGVGAGCTHTYTLVWGCAFLHFYVVKIPVTLAAIWCSGPLLNVMAARV